MASIRFAIFPHSKPLYLQKLKAIIQFNNLPKTLKTSVVKNALLEYIPMLGYQCKKMVYNFVSKEMLLEMNQRYLKHNTHTDIISFDYSENKEIEAEFYISFWAIEESAKTTGENIENELLRVIVHGPLHCMGWSDKTEKEQKAMRAQEDKFIELFHVKHNENV